MGEAALDRIIFGLITLPFVIFAFVRIFIRENRRNDELFYDRAKLEIQALRAHVDALAQRLDDKDRELDGFKEDLRIAHSQSRRLEEDVFRLKAELGLDPNAETL
jgi:hypothetical protein